MDLEERVEDTLRTWYDKVESLQAILDLYMAAKFGHTFVESRFLTLCQAIEGFHRSELGGTFMKPEKYLDEVLPQLLKGIPAQLPSDLKEALNARLKFGNEVSLRRRVREVFRFAIPESVLNVKHMVTWANEIVDARNALVHQVAGRPPEGEELDLMMHASECLEGLLELSLLKLLKFPEGKLASRARSQDGTRAVALP